MLRRENQLRLASDTIARFESLSLHGLGGWLQEAQRLGEQVVAEFGFGQQACRPNRGTLEEGLSLLRSAVASYPGDSEVLAAANYLRFNRCVEGVLRVGDPAPDCELHLPDGSPTTLHSLLRLAPPGAHASLPWAPVARAEQALCSVVVGASIT